MTTCKFLKQEPSLSSMKPKVFMSRMVRAQPLTVTSRPPKRSWSAKICAIFVRSISPSLNSK